MHFGLIAEWVPICASRRAIKSWRGPKRKWGPALLPAPTAPSDGSAGVRNLVDKPCGLPDPFSILAHQLRRRFPSNSSLGEEEPV